MLNSNEIGKKKQIEEPLRIENTAKINENVNDAEMQQLLATMQSYMQDNKPYLNSEFSVYQLAEALNIPRRRLSHALSQGLNTNFSQYINECRINEVKELLKDHDNKSSILQLAFKSGFKSKFSFNSLFKKHCSVTPSQYRALKRKQTATQWNFT